MRQVFARSDIRARVRKLSTPQLKALLERVVMTLFPTTAATEELLDADHEWSSDNHDWLYDELTNAGLIPESREAGEEERNADIRSGDS